MEKETLTVRVQPNSRKNEVVGLKNGLWRLKIAAPPVKGMANRELISFLSDILEISQGNIAIETGMASRLKTLSISGLTEAQIKARLERHMRKR